MDQQSAQRSKEYSLVARVVPHNEPEYLQYLQEVYGPGLATMPGFVSLRVVKWTISDQPNATLEGNRTEFLRISTWATRADADAYYVHPLRATFGRLLELATVLAYGGAEVMVDVRPDAQAASE